MPALSTSSHWGFVGIQRQPILTLAKSPADARFRGSRQQPPALGAVSVPNGSYIAPAGNASVLFRVQNQRRQPIPASEIGNLGITQNDILEVDPFVLSTFPLELTRQRAAGRDLQTQLWSDLKAGHFMESWAWLQGTTLTLRTETQTVTWFGGYTGGVAVTFYDAAGNRILYDTIRSSYGIDGRAFGPGWREDTETVQLPQNISDATESIVISHYWAPKQGIVDTILDAIEIIWCVVQKLGEERDRGEEVNGGGNEF